MNKEIYDNYVAILRSELVPALGCTEPIAIAYAGAKARETLGYMPDGIIIRCSGNIIKNVKGVTVPNSGGMKGIDVAATLGVVAGKADNALEVLQSVQEKDIQTTKDLVADGFCKCDLLEGVENLHIIAEVFGCNENALVEIVGGHTHITRIEKNGEKIFEQDELAEEKEKGNRDLLNVRDIIEFAETVDINDVKEILDRQIKMNSEIAETGIENHYGAEVGRTLISVYGDADVRVRARAYSAAGSDARMNGCAMPVVINSGSGNQGITLSIPVIEYAKELHSTDEELYRALVVANLIAVHQKRYIGKLSAYCGATSAGCSAACGISFLQNGRYDEISGTIKNTIANIGGIVCDGAKASCAAKIASAVDAGIMGLEMSKRHHVYPAGEGLVEEDLEQTIQNLGRMGRDGMRSTDVEILNIMLGN